MALPELTRQQVERRLTAFCDARVPAHVRNKVRLAFSIRGNKVTLIEERVGWQDPSRWIQSPVARFDYDAASGAWTLRCRDRNCKWYFYELQPPTKRFDDLIEEVQRDPTGIFWG